MCVSHMYHLSQANALGNLFPRCLNVFIYFTILSFCKNLRHRRLPHAPIAVMRSTKGVIHTPLNSYVLPKVEATCSFGIQNIPCVRSLARCLLDISPYNRVSKLI